MRRVSAQITKPKECKYSKGDKVIYNLYKKEGIIKECIIDDGKYYYTVEIDDGVIFLAEDELSDEIQ
jgi:hypothetical protein